MMIENVMKFKQALQENRELADQFTEELKRIAEEKSADSDAQAIVQAAKTLGFDFTIADVEKAQAEIQELDPKELDQAAGGEDSWCMFDFACFTAVRHDTPDKPPYACFKDYACVTIYHHDWKVDE